MVTAPRLFARITLTAFIDEASSGFRSRLVADTVDVRQRAGMPPDLRVAVVRVIGGNEWGWLVWDADAEILASDGGHRLGTQTEAEYVASAAARQWYTLADDDENELVWCGHDECDGDFCDHAIEGPR